MENTKQLIELVRELKTTLFYQLEALHGATGAFNYPLIKKANEFLAKAVEYEPKGEFVNDGYGYEFCGYTLTQSVNDGVRVATSLGFEVDEFCGIQMIDEDSDIKEIQDFEETMITLLKGASHI